MFGGKRVLQIAHNHPKFYPGGTEIVALALHREALRHGLDSWFLSAAAPDQKPLRPGANLAMGSDTTRESSILDHEFDLFRLSQANMFGFLDTFREYLEYVRPDVVHLHHLISFGLESLFLIRSALPTSTIVLTLHDYYLICANRGQLFKSHSQQRCEGPELSQCKICLPERKWSELELRAIDIQNALMLCNHVVSPSLFLKETFERCGLLQDQIKFVENGYIGAVNVTETRVPSKSESPFRFGYFGNLSQVKGLHVLIEAAILLRKRTSRSFTLVVYGSMLIEDDDLKRQIAEAKDTIGVDLIFKGSYKQSEVGTYMASIDCLVFPSIWWENAPLVLYEAIQNECPVIALPNGGAAEILKRYNVGAIAQDCDSHSLSETMNSILDGKSVKSIPINSISKIEDVLKTYASIYQTEVSEVPVYSFQS